MRFLTNIFALGIAILLMPSCASSYKPLVPESMHFEARAENDGVVLHYKHGVLGERGNKKYVKKETRNFLKVVAVKLTNNSATTIDVSRDIKFFSGPNQFSPLDPITVHSRLKQGVPIYLLYLLFTPMEYTQITTVNGHVTEKSASIGLLLGPGLTLYNIIKAGSANQRMLENLQKYSVINKQIAPGETLHGLVVIPNGGYNPLTIKVGSEELQSKQ